MSNEMVSLADELRALLAQVDAMRDAISSGGAILPAEREGPRIEDLFELANEELRARSRRAVHFPDALFREPAWDILLDLYVHASKSKEVTVTSACLAAQVPATTGLRWIGLLEGKGYITRQPSQRDRRVVILTLTEGGRERIERALSERLHQRNAALKNRAALASARPTGNPDPPKQLSDFSQESP